MADQDELKQLRTLNLRKATQIRQMGFKSSIHALPPDVKLRLDQLLTMKISPRAALAELCQQFPRVELPSPKAVEHYRNKYHKATLSKKITLIANREIEMDMKKLELQRSIMEQIMFITTDILPKLVKRVEICLEKEDQIGLPIKITDSSVYTLSVVIKMLNDFLNKNGVYLFTEEEVTLSQKQRNISEPPFDVNNAEMKLEELLESRGLKLERRTPIST